MWGCVGGYIGGMGIYAGIDEAGYGPMFGPLTVGCVVMDVASDRQGAMLWDDLGSAVCRTLKERKVRGARSGGGRIAVNDSKKLHTKASGIKHLEMGVLSFARLCGWEARKEAGVESEKLKVKSGERECGGLGEWLKMMGNEATAWLPWYEMGSDGHDDGDDGGALPSANDEGELAIQVNSLKRAMRSADVTMKDWRTAVVFEDRFNAMTAMTKSKAATSFTFVAKHLDFLWREFGQSAGGVRVVVDRQSGRQRYRELLASICPRASLQIEDESPHRSAYRLTEGDRVMVVSFEVEAEQHHMPVALASMSAKYTRELLMYRFQAYFQKYVPEVKPTAGYGQDAKRFWEEIGPRLAELGIDGKTLRRMA